MEFETATSFGCNIDHEIINKSRLYNHLHYQVERQAMQ
jgi:hypothetical protein